MGCSICLDPYDTTSDNDRSRRPVALTCGHIFHKECSDGWLRHCKLQNGPATCPICKQIQGDSKALLLWPGDVRDIDAYLANRHKRVHFQETASEERPAPATTALDRYLPRKDQAKLLGNLMDFRQHINAYVMAINNVSMSTRGGENRIYRLFADVQKSEKEKQVDFEAALKSLSSAAKVFSDTAQSISAQQEEIKSLHQKAKDECDEIAKMKQYWNRHMEIRNNEQHQMNDERSRVKRIEMHLKLELQRIEKDKIILEHDRRVLEERVREREQEALKTKLETSHLVAQSEGHAKGEIERMKGYVMEQERLRIDAENRARDVQSKNNTLADRFKLLTEKLSQSRREVKRLKASKEVPLVKSEEVVESLAPRVASQLDDDGFVEVGCNRGTTAPIKRARLTLDQDDSAIVVLDDEEEDYGDSHYPMPGFLHRHRNLPTSYQPSSSHHPVEVIGDNSVEFMGGILARPQQDRSFLATNEEYLQRAISGPLTSLGARVRRRRS